uniref:Uncharacterized protein n=1 Tax=viral metagenome TaxID=1070528 RepID=A0A6M3KYL4_9ZZZZ
MADRFEMDVYPWADQWPREKRVKSDKRFPNGVFHVWIPDLSKDLGTISEVLVNGCKDFYNCTFEELVVAGQKQRSYGETSFNAVLQSDAKKVGDVPIEEQIARLEAAIAPLNSEDLPEKAAKFFEDALTHEAKARTSQGAVKTAKANVYDQIAKELGVEAGTDVLAMVRAIKAAAAEKAAKAGKGSK